MLININQDKFIILNPKNTPLFCNFRGYEDKRGDLWLNLRFIKMNFNDQSNHWEKLKDENGKNVYYTLRFSVSKEQREKYQEQLKKLLEVDDGLSLLRLGNYPLIVFKDDYIMDKKEPEAAKFNQTERFKVSNAPHFIRFIFNDI